MKVYGDIETLGLSWNPVPDAVHYNIFKRKELGMLVPPGALTEAIKWGLNPPPTPTGRKNKAKFRAKSKAAKQSRKRNRK